MKMTPTQRGFEDYEDLIVDYLLDATVYVRHRELPVHGYGKTLTEALEAWHERYAVWWKFIVDAPIESLAPYGERLRRRFLVGACKHGKPNK